MNPPSSTKIRNGSEAPDILRRAWAVGLVSFTLLALQLTLMQSLSYSQGHHLAYIVISIALLGFGASGSVLFAVRARAGCRIETLFVPSLLACGLLTAWLHPLAYPLVGGLEVNLLESNPKQWALLGGLGFLLFLPFFCGASALAIAFTSQHRSIGPLYGANLAGSALGSGGALALLHVGLPEELLPFLGFACLVAAFPNRPKPAAPVSKLVFPAALLGVALPAFLPDQPVLSEYKPLNHALRMPEATHTPPAPHPLGRLESVQAPSLRHAPDLSLRYRGPVPSPQTLFVKGQTYARLLPRKHEGAAIMGETPRALPFAMGEFELVWLLGPEGSPMIHLARNHGAATIVHEPHSLVAEKLRNTHAGERAVSIRNAHPRAALNVRPGDGPTQPDLIVFPQRGYFGGPVGLQALGEDFLFTVEAVGLAFERLAENGFLAFSVWLDEPLRHAPRLLDLAAEALRRRGVENPADHFALVRGWGSLAFVVGKKPLEEPALRKLETFVGEKGFDALGPPAVAEKDRRLHGSRNDGIDRARKHLLGSSPAEFREKYPFAISAPTDDRPFFNQFLGLEHLVDFSGEAGLGKLTVSERGLFFIAALLVLLTFATLFLIAGPLAALRRPVRNAGFTLLYFAGLGAGFMFIEIALIQRFTLLWGSPLHSAAGVIGALLCGMGLGSTLSHYLPVGRPLLVLATLLPAVLYGGLLLGSGPLFEALLAGPPIARFGIGIALLFFPAVLLGLPFPLGTRMLARTHPDQIPWAFGINGCLSVLTAPAAGMLALAFGFTSLAFATALAYGLAALGVACHR